MVAFATSVTLFLLDSIFNTINCTQIDGTENNLGSFLTV